ncbi:MAG: glycosyl transferase [Clostridia bacterium]|nr:glycosyl transferase [Clostridia bacterium]
MAHNNFPQLKRLLKKLDHVNNKIFIHIDAKADFSDFDREMLVGACNESEIFFIQRYSLSWGGYSQVFIPLKLLEEAVKHSCDYYHLLSNADFPIKSMEYIHSFLEEHKGTEFIHFCSDEFVKQNISRVSLYSFFRDRFGRNTKSIYYLLERISVTLQRVLRVDRTKKYPDLEIKMGSNWFSITDAFAKYLLKTFPSIQNIFKYTTCADEIYIQTIAFHSPFKDNIYYFKNNIPANESYLRSVDWSRKGSAVGAPCDYTVDDYDTLINSKNLFARKISALTEKGNSLIEKLELL